MVNNTIYTQNPSPMIKYINYVCIIVHYGNWPCKINIKELRDVHSQSYVCYKNVPIPHYGRYFD